MMRTTCNIILHYHIFKNAGSTFTTALERNFGTRFAQLHSPHPNARISGEALLDFVYAQPEVVAISSHHLSPPAPKADSVQFQEVLILRDPLDRIRSMYDFYRRCEINDDPLTVEAKHLGLREFLEYLLEKRAHLLVNAQTNIIANAGTKVPDEGDLKRALSMLKTMAVVGVVEDFDLCALQAEHTLQALFPGLDLSYVRENVTPLRVKDLQLRLHRFRDACGEVLFTQLVESNRRDMELHAAARGESLRRWQAIGGQKAKLRNFARRRHKRVFLGTVTNQFARVRRLCLRTVKLLSRPQPGPI